MHAAWPLNYEYCKSYSDTSSLVILRNSQVEKQIAQGLCNGKK
jgi:hypothetical protein